MLSCNPPIPFSSSTVRPPKGQKATKTRRREEHSRGDCSLSDRSRRPLKMVISRPDSSPPPLFSLAVLPCFVPFALRIAIWRREFLGIQIFLLSFFLCPSVRIRSGNSSGESPLDVGFLPLFQSQMRLSRECFRLLSPYASHLCGCFQVVLQPDRFLSELTSMYERSTEKGSVWVTMKRCECPSLLTRMVVCRLEWVKS